MERLIVYLGMGNEEVKRCFFLYWFRSIEISCREMVIRDCSFFFSLYEGLEIKGEKKRREEGLEE